MMATARRNGCFQKDPANDRWCSCRWKPDDRLTPHIQHFRKEKPMIDLCELIYFGNYCVEYGQVEDCNLWGDGAGQHLIPETCFYFLSFSSFLISFSSSSVTSNIFPLSPLNWNSSSSNSLLSFSLRSLFLLKLYCSSALFLLFAATASSDFSNGLPGFRITHTLSQNCFSN